MRVALNQMSAGPDPHHNLKAIEAGVADAVRGGAEVVVFPEAAMACFGTPLGAVAEPLDGPWAEAVRGIAARAGVTVVAGMFTPAPDGRVANTLLVTGGGVDTHYDKVHLYNAFDYRESDSVLPGRELVTFTRGGLTFGVATCYDVRFPHLFQELAARGAHAILLPASWGEGPGKAEQWDVLVRARALDSTSWVLACDQALPEDAGQRPPSAVPRGIGRTVVVTPLGEVVQQLGLEPGQLLVDVDTETVAAVRRKLPVLENRVDLV
ncbi:carbon-nitrogen hydrolase family protein [Kitasatospora mediocidica]|uniref:carbon-nitrogen hydrolase family protein n=1 Tax=Kitasatospora mediocidica TaxID=58352 RepID=UPI0018DC023F|nr:carbon-nitrogen hydrolase family protein [Kitasatospora mediocidica]